MELESPFDYGFMWHGIGASARSAEAGAPGVTNRFEPGAFRVSGSPTFAMGNWFGFADVPGHSLEQAVEVLGEVIASGNTHVGFASTGVAGPLMTRMAGSPLVDTGTVGLMIRNAQPILAAPRPYSGTVKRLEHGASTIPAFDVVGRAWDIPAERNYQPVFQRATEDPNLIMMIGGTGANVLGEIDSMCMAYRYGPLCYVHLLATRPDRQRLGAGWAVLAKVIATAIEEGAEGIYLLASDAGRFLYTPMGFRLVEEVRFWVANPTQPPPAST